MEYRSLFRRVSVIGVTAACALALAGCSGSNYGYTGGVAATVNGTEIQEDTVTKYIQDFRTNSDLMYSVSQRSSHWPSVMRLSSVSSTSR